MSCSSFVAIRDRETALSRITERDAGVTWSTGEAIAEFAATADDLHREIQIYSDHLFRRARWEVELLKLDLPTDKVMPLAERAVKSLAIVVGRLIQAEIFGVAAVPFATLGGPAALLAAAMLLASILPARRAARMDPNVVLREK